VTSAAAGAAAVLVVEDEKLIAQYLDDELRLAGFRSFATVDTVEAALDALARARPDLAILDRKLCNQDTGQVADALKAQGVPFLFISGVGPEALPPRHRNARCITKPFEWQTVLGALHELLDEEPRRATT